jgi:hypothetical protein
MLFGHNAVLFALSLNEPLLHQAALPDKMAKKQTSNIPRNLIFFRKDIFIRQRW